MDLYDESRTLVYLGPIYRRSRSETGFTEKWTELTGALMDNYCKFGWAPLALDVHMLVQRSCPYKRGKGKKRVC